MSSISFDDNFLKQFECNILDFLLGSLTEPFRLTTLQKHDKYFETNGDFSFSILFKYWLSKQTSEETPLAKNCATLTKIFEINHPAQEDEKVLVDLKELSQSWKLKINRTILIQERVLLFLDRTNAFQTALQQACFANEDHLPNDLLKNHKVTCDLEENQAFDIQSLTLTQWRMHLVKKVLENILNHSQNSTLTKFSHIHVSTKNQNKEEKLSDVNIVDKYIFCAPITNIEDSKKSNLDVRTYIKLRMIDLQRNKLNQDEDIDENIICESLPSHELVIAASSLELLGSKTHQPIQLRLNSEQTVNRQSSHRGVIFILYNYARIATLLKQFEESVQSNYYPELIAFDKVNWSLLDKEEEWIILFNFILNFPKIQEDLVKELNSENQLGLNLQLCTSFLSNLALSFSRYYRRYRILIEPRPHLLPSLFARIYLLKGLRNVFLKTLNILNIKSFEHL